MKNEMRERYLEFFETYLRMEEEVQDVKRVTNVEQITNSGGVCDSCYSEWEEVNITYETTDGDVVVYNTYGSLADFFQ